MLALAGIPATAGFTGKFYLIDAAVSGGYAWLGVVIVIGSMISFGYYLPVIAAMWMRPAVAGAGQSASAGDVPVRPLPRLAGGSADADEEAPLAPDGTQSGARVVAALGAQPEVALVAALALAATIFFGIVPQPLFDLVNGAGRALGLH
jgi:NADH-quinone oxidoreductase subunit N